MSTETAREFRVRRSAFEREVVWRLAADGFDVLSGDRPPLRVPYASVVRLRLSYDPTRLDSSRRRCEIETRQGARLRIVSTSYVGLANFENRSATYVPFVRDLVARVAAANPACAFVGGKKAGVYIAEHAFLLLVVLALAVVLLVIGVPTVGVVTLHLVALAAYVPIAIRYARDNWPKSFDPAAIPERLLPPA